MSKLDELIQELCPNGVEYKTLNDVSDFRNGKGHEKDISDSGAYIVVNSKFISTEGAVCKYSDKQIVPLYKNEILMVMSDLPNGKAIAKCFIVDNDDKYTLNQRIGAFKVYSEIMNPKFLFYVLNRNKQLLRYDNGVDQTNLRKDDILKISIPVPPLEVQCEIVRILDNFTELTAELTARKKQYEYYRDTLLTFDKNDASVEFVKLSDVAQYSSERIEASELDENSYVGVDNLLQNKQGKTASNYVPTEGRLTKFVSGDILIGNIRPYLRKIWLSDTTGGTNGDVLAIHISNKSKVCSEYLYYILSSEAFFHYDTQNSKGAKMPRGDKSMVMKYEFPIPSLEEQERIVSILDRFDALCNDISIGLPAEIEARQKQYEYYRDKLLTFKEKTA